MFSMIFYEKSNVGLTSCLFWLLLFLHKMRQFSALPPFRAKEDIPFDKNDINLMKPVYSDAQRALGLTFKLMRLSGHNEAFKTR